MCIHAYSISLIFYQKFSNEELVLSNVRENNAYVGAMRLYITKEVINEFDVSVAYYHDCAAFMSLKSLAISKYTFKMILNSN